MTDRQLTWMTSAQAAGRLGIQPATLAAYVSRVIIDCTKDADGRSTFTTEDVESFVADHQAGAPLAATGGVRPTVLSPRLVLDSDITFIDGDELYFRGRRAVGLAQNFEFEDAIEFLWAREYLKQRSGTELTVDESPALPFAPRERAFPPFAVEEATVRQARRAGSALGPAGRLLDRMKLAVLITGSHDLLRYDLSTKVVWSSGQRMITAMVDSLPGAGISIDPGSSLAARLWTKLSPELPSPADIALLNVALVLCMDHDLAASTMAARVAASARANPYAAVSAALGAFDSSLYGSSTIGAKEMLEQTLVSGNEQKALSMQLNKGRGVPGFGHRVYQHRDPRATYLLDRMREHPRFRDVVKAADRLTSAVHARAPRPMNMDLALSGFALGARMNRDACELILAVARTAGWIAHIVDEYSQAPLRLRPESNYVGPFPTADEIVGANPA